MVARAMAMVKLDVHLVLLLVDLWVHAVIGDYEVEVDFHSYSNPTGHCLQCVGGASGCCDVSSTVSLDQDCPAPGTCNTALAYCNRTVRTTGLCPQSEQMLAPSVLVNRRSFNFESAFFGLSNPVIISNTGPWQSLQILLLFRECDINFSGNRCFVSNNIIFDLIDNIFINIDIAVGTSIQATYNGVTRISRVTASIEVKCADDFYGPDCSTQCSTFVNCAGCGLSGFTGQFCQFGVGDCTDNYCNGNGSCIEGSSLCDCNPGFTGDRCETNIDDCVGVNCNNGTCVDEINKSTCDCYTGFTGDRCETNIDDCAGVNCNNGTCMDKISNFSCACSAGFTGDRCEININDCEDIDCNNGMCIDEINDFRCNCDTGFTGDHCEINIDYCEGVNCNNGICVDENEDENFRCDCFTGFTGALCLDGSAATAGVGSIAGGVVGALIGAILIAIIVIMVVIVVVQVRRTKGHTFNGSGSGTGSASLESIPSYSASPRSFQHHDYARYQEIPSHRSNNSNGTPNNPVVASLQEREFDNPIYGSEEVQERELDNPIYGADDDPAAEGVESEDPYTVPESPPSNVYDRVADDVRVESVSASGGSNIYSTIPT